MVLSLKSEKVSLERKPMLNFEAKTSKFSILFEKRLKLCLKFSIPPWCYQETECK